mgnify:CR=1 FL=1
MQLRRFDAAGLRDYLGEVRPRFVMLRLRTEKVNISWGVPLWAAEEVLGFALGVAALLNALAPRALNRFGAGSALGVRVESDNAPRPTTTAALLEAWRTLNALAGGSLRDVLRVPPGEAYLEVRAANTHIHIAAY